MSAVPRARDYLTPSLHVSAATVAVAALIAVAALASPLVLALAVVLCGGMVAWGWAGALALPTPRGTAGVLLVAAVAVPAAVLLLDGSVQAVPLALGLCLVLALWHQLLRRDGRPRLVESVSGVSLALGVLALGGLLLPVGFADPLLVCASMAAVVVSAGVDLLAREPRLRPWLAPVGMVLGAGAVVAVTSLGEVAVPTAVLLGVLTAPVSQAVRWVLAGLPTLVHLRPQLVSAAASVLVAGGVLAAVTRIFLSGSLPA